jgi:TolB-like protein
MGIITHSGAFIIGRSTAFTYKGKAADVRQIGREPRCTFSSRFASARASARRAGWMSPE